MHAFPSLIHRIPGISVRAKEAAGREPGNLAIEFRPEIHRKVFGQKQGSQIQTPAMSRSVRIKVAFRPSTSPFFELMTTEPALPFEDGSPADRYLPEMISCATSSPHMPYTVPAVHAPTE